MKRRSLKFSLLGLIFLFCHGLAGSSVQALAWADVAESTYSLEAFSSPASDSLVLGQRAPHDRDAEEPGGQARNDASDPIGDQQQGASDAGSPGDEVPQNHDAEPGSPQPPDPIIGRDPAVGQEIVHDDPPHAAPIAPHHEEAHDDLGMQLPLISIVPFLLMLMSIALLPLIVPHWWEHNRNKLIVGLILSLPVVLLILPMWEEASQHVLIEKLEEYASFITLLASLYVISGGIYIKGSLSGRPASNTAILGIGTLLASFIGTTGASVLLIRPLLRANKARKWKVHIVVFFIFTVSNCGGLLTPLGDPPLYLGFLKGVPFEWTFFMLWPEWLALNIALLSLFFVWDSVTLRREDKTRPGSQWNEVLEHEPFRILGIHNFVLLLGVVAIIYARGQNFGTQGHPWPFGIQEGLMAGLAVLGYLTTSKNNRRENRFTFGPINEVAFLFIGIFITMAPALLILNSWGRGDRDVLGMGFGLSEPWQFFWVTGLLSSFLDNAPTYLTFAATACGLENVDVSRSDYLRVFLETGPRANALLASISVGAVFMGAMTYIGNGPNFMVKAMAEESGIKMPSFFGYMVYSFGILVPLLIVLTLVFHV